MRIWFCNNYLWWVSRKTLRQGREYTVNGMTLYRRQKSWLGRESIALTGILFRQLRTWGILRTLVIGIVRCKFWSLSYCCWLLTKNWFVIYFNERNWRLTAAAHGTIFLNFCRAPNTWLFAVKLFDWVDIMFAEHFYFLLPLDSSLFFAWHRSQAFSFRQYQEILRDIPS